MKLPADNFIVISSKESLAGYIDEFYRLFQALPGSVCISQELWDELRAPYLEELGAECPEEMYYEAIRLITNDFLVKGKALVIPDNSFEVPGTDTVQ